MKYFLIVTACLISLMACSTTENRISNYQLPSLNQGQSPTTVAQMLKTTPQHIFSTTSNYIIHRYVIFNGVQSNWYYLAYQNSQLVYWGYAHEYKRKSPALSNAMKEVMAAEAKRYNAEVAKQKAAIENNEI